MREGLIRASPRVLGRSMEPDRLVRRREALGGSGASARLCCSGTASNSPVLRSTLAGSLGQPSRWQLESRPLSQCSKPVARPLDPPSGPTLIARFPGQEIPSLKLKIAPAKRGTTQEKPLQEGKSPLL